MSRRAIADQVPLVADLPKALDHQRLADAYDEHLLRHRDPAVLVDDDESAGRRLHRIAGIEARHWSAVGDGAASDREVFQWARRHGFVLLTHERRELS